MEKSLIKARKNDRGNGNVTIAFANAKSWHLRINTTHLSTIVAHLDQGRVWLAAIKVKRLMTRPRYIHIYVAAERWCKIFHDSLMFCNGSCSGTYVDRSSRWPMTRSSSCVAYKKNDRCAIAEAPEQRRENRLCCFCKFTFYPRNSVTFSRICRTVTGSFFWTTRWNDESEHSLNQWYGFD